ncbi:MAG: hypothetical protein M3R59_06035 [Verrucomicrobiota bacterium]|nr:hypothetical protein [Verrucomicrobiota bacterium]
MQDPTEIAERGIRYAQDQFSEIAAQTEDFVREKPAQSLLYAFLAGVILNRLPVGRVLSGLLRLVFILLKPAVLFYGASKVYETIREEK